MNDTSSHPLFRDEALLKLGQAHEPLSIDSMALNRQGALMLAQQAKRSLLIISRDLDPAVYDNEPFCTAVSQLLRGNRKAQMRIVLHNVDSLIKQGHRLLDLAQRLSSFIQIRTLHPRHAQFNEAFMLADDRGVIHRRQSDLYQGEVFFNNPALAKSLQAQFTDLWEHGQSNPNLRRLSI